VNEWQVFFDGFAPNYDDQVFTKNTEEEIEFLIEELSLLQGASILDIGCGTGRHSLGLVLKGYRVTGIDISQSMLKIAEEKMLSMGVSVDFICCDAKDYISDNLFDAAICLCEGAICLISSEDDPFERDLQVLRNINTSLKKGARLILNVVNGIRLLRSISDQDIAEGRYDILSMVEINQMDFVSGGVKKQIQARERGYTPPELKRILELAEFDVEHIYGGTAGAWNRETPKLDEYELMAITRKV